MALLERINRIFGMFVLVMLLTAPQTINAQAYQIKTIVIDAGHGGKDPGAVGKKAKEKDINLNVALLSGGYIEKYLPDVKVIYTRKTDKFVKLIDRAEMANKAKADLFISIHVNAVGNSRVQGASTWLFGFEKFESNLKLAKLENSVIELEEDYEETYHGFDPNKDESYIIFNFNSTKAYFEQSLSLAQELQNQFKNRVGRKDHGIRQGPFWVLHATTMPSVLIELGFITNTKEESFLMTTSGQEYLASAIFRSVRSYKQQIEAKNKIGTALVEKKPESNIAPKVAESDKNIVNSQDISDEPKEVDHHGVRFKVQFLLSKTRLDTNNAAFAGLSDIWEYKDGSYYKYTTGNTVDLLQIIEIQKKVKQKYPDAFIAAFKDNERISVAEAKRLINVKN